MDGLHAISVLLIMFGFYMFPTSIAFFRQHNNKLAISVLNLLLGWTIIGWVVSLVWALTSDTKNTQVKV